MDPMTAMAAPPGEAAAINPAAPTRLDRSAVSWAAFQGFRDPYLGLIGNYVFMPYFATVLIHDPVAGQEATATIGKVTGLGVAIAAPLLGASIDRIGPRKPLLGLCVAVFVPLVAALWFAAPDGPLSVRTIMAMLAIAGLLFTMIDILFSSMLPTAAAPAARSRASGLALSLGNVVGFALIAAVLWAFALPGTVAAPGIVPAQPLLGLDHATFETSRIVGPIVAIVFALGAIPLFLFTRDAPRPPRDATPAPGQRNPFAGFAGLRGERDVLTYIVVRTVSQDAGMVLLIMGGVFASGIMGWGATQMLAYGLLATIGGVGAGALASYLDQRVGPRRALQIEIAGTLIALIGMIGTNPRQILYLWRWDNTAAPVPLPNMPFATLPDLAFLGIAMTGLVFQIAAWSSSRTLLVALAPAERVGSCFGLAAFAAATTGWLGPLLVGWATATWATQQAGMVPIAVLLVIGLAGLSLVRGGGRPVAR
ncbi:MFS transporter [Sphingomonas endophytica]|nr:MFS transporter [Sphingomonas endophytica]